jgi:CBS domain containing-hemolysin-like protein
MVPRVDVFSLPIDTKGPDAIKALRSHEFTRVLLTKGRSLDEVSGYLYAKDVFLDPGAPALADLSTLRRDVQFVPETQSLLDVLRLMQRTGTHIAVVVDEYGGSSGILTMEDVLEEIVGEIRDEFDEEPARVQPVPGEERTWDVDARATMDELKPLGVQVSDEEAAETLGAVVLERLGRLPRRGDKVNLGVGSTAEVMTLSRRRVTGLRVVVMRAPEDSVPE